MTNTLFPELNNNDSLSKSKAPDAPLAHQLAPESFENYIGQQHLIAPGKPLRTWIDQNQVPSLLLWGPPGVGKTALARLISKLTKMQFISLNAVMSKVQDIRTAIASAATSPQKTAVFIDEIHRFNKSQQDALLPSVEKGDIILIGATTENPHFAINPSIISRCQVFELNPLTPTEVDTLITQALSHPKLENLKNMNKDLRENLSRQCHGDARKLINLLEALSNLQQKSDNSVSKETLAEIIGKAGVAHSTDSHYDIISAYIKSVRASKSQDAIYWLARMIKGGEDPQFIARRLVILASEDIGNADPAALPLAVAAMQTVQFIGMPEAKYTLSQATLYLANAPKSREATNVINNALKYVEDGNIHPVPDHLKSR